MFNTNGFSLAVEVIASGGDYVLQSDILPEICAILLHKQFCFDDLSLCRSTEGTMLKMTACQIGQNMPVVVGVQT